MIALSWISLIAFLEGFISLGIEVTAMRQVIPFYGNSLEITTYILSVFLLALSAGYYRGGTIKAHHINRLMVNFFGVLSIAPIFMSYLAMKIIFSGGSMGAFWVWLILVVGVPVYMLGQTLPLLSSIGKFKTHARASGTVLFFSTVGSAIGVVLVGAVLFNTIGVSYTLIAQAFLLMAALSILHRFEPNRLLMAGGLMAIVMAFFFNSSNAFVLQNAYANVSIERDDANTTYFKTNANYSSLLTKDGEPAPYIMLMRETTEALLDKDDEVLIIGAGGFTFSSGFDYVKSTYIEINPDLRPMAERHFLKRGVNGEVYHGDARAYVHLLKNRYDAILLDAYSGLASVPAHLITVEFFRQMKERLNKGGYVAVNMLVDPLFQDAYSQGFKRTLESSFDNCSYVTRSMHKGLSNVVAVCSDNVTDEKPFRDDLNRASMLSSQHLDIKLGAVK